MASTENLTPAALAQLMKEIRDLEKKPCDGIKVIFNEDNLADVQAEIEGPAGTPFEGGLFRMKLVLGSDFPTTAPKGYFLTKIFHPNVAKEGDICVNVLKKDWKPDLGLRHVLLVIRCLLIEPFPESALNEEAGKLLLEDYEEYEKHAKLMTSIHAQPPKRPMPLTTSGANSAAEKPLAHEGGSGGASPAAKKTKGGDKAKSAAVAAKKKSLKRL